MYLGVRRKTGPLLITVMLFITCICYGRQLSDYNLNIYNGLASNHVYKCFKDRHGYLWLGTTKGVFRYNGYELKQFTNVDTWNFYEDNRGRLWLYTSGDEVGYIYKNSYHKVHKDKDDFIFQPVDIRDYKEGVYFVSSYFDKAFCIEKNDTIRTILTKDLFLNSTGVLEEDFTRDIKQLKFRNGKFYKSHITNYRKYGGQVILRTIGPYFIIYSNTNGVRITNYEKDTTATIFFNSYPGEKVYVAHPNNRSVMFITNKVIYKVDSLFRPEVVFTIDNAHAGNDFTDQVTYFADDPFWGINVSTQKNGHYISYKNDQFIKTSVFNISGSRYMGRSATGSSFWWDELNKILTDIDTNNKTSHYRIPIEKLKKIVSYNDSVSLIITYNDLFWLDNVSKKITDFFSNKNYYYINIGGKVIAYKNGPKQDDSNTMSGFYDVDLRGNNMCLLNRYKGINFLKFFSDTVLNEHISLEKYSSIIYDSNSKNIYACNNEKVFVCNTETKKKVSLKLPDFLELNIIENIFVDQKHGHIFIKGTDRLLVYDPIRKVFKELFSFINLANSIATLSDDKLIIAGKFGVGYITVKGPSALSPPVLYPNIKGINYHRVFDLQPGNKEFILNTDKGVFSVSVKDNIPQYNQYSVPLPRFTATYSDTIKNIASGDTIKIEQHNAKVQFDVINPGGVGTVNYIWKLKGVTNEFKPMNSNELYFHQLQAGQHYTLSVLASDDIWRGNELNLNIYIIPYWWQTSLGKQFLLTLFIIGLILITLLIVFTTRRVINRKNEKRNRLLELELKSVYSQINPHFIFNTLNSALHFIKKQKLEEAHSHILRFSKLLRGYLKSSRTRLLTLEEEIANIRNYIELQQTRFDDHFSYSITLEGIEDTSKIGIPSLLIQPFIENAINHGLLPKETKGNLDIAFIMNKQQLLCIIDDDGIGRERSKKSENRKERESYGNYLVAELVDVFNKYEGMDISLEYTDKELPSTGTIVTLIIRNPFIYG